MRLAAVIFSDSPPIYRRYAKALQQSVAERSPRSRLDIALVEDADVDVYAVGRGLHRPNSYTQNARKTRHHHRFVASLPDGEEVCMLDLDMMVLRDVSEETHGEYDLGYTLKARGSILPLNTGAVFARVSDRVRQFYREWEDAALRFLRDAKLHQRYIKECGGVNQSSLVWMLEREHSLQRVITLPAREWNCTKEAASTARDQAKIAHILSSVRSLALHARTKSDVDGYNWLADQWRGFEKRFVGPLRLERTPPCSAPSCSTGSARTTSVG